MAHISKLLFVLQEIDSYIQKASDQGYSAVLSLGSKGFSYVTNAALNTAIMVGPSHVKVE